MKIVATRNHCHHHNHYHHHQELNVMNDKYHSGVVELVLRSGHEGYIFCFFTSLILERTAA